MAQKSSFFNSVNGDRKYNAETFASYFKSFIGNGVYPNPSSNLFVSAAAGMNITIAAGKGFINGYFYENTTPLNKAIDVSDGALKRIDRVVLRLDHVGRQITIEVKKGTPASTPTAPALTWNADIHELALADVRINNGDTSVLQANITDQRLNTSLCGIVHGVVEQVDTAAIFSQYQASLNDFETVQQAEFESWVEGLKQVLDENTAGNLLNLINDHKGDSNAHFTLGEKSELKARFNADGKALQAVTADNAANSDKLGGKAASEFATAAQGTKADAALPKSGGTMTGVLTAGGSQTISVQQVRNCLYSATDITAGSTSLATGNQYHVYE